MTRPASRTLAGGLLAGALLALAAAGHAVAQEATAPGGAVTVLIDVERVLLDEDIAAHRRLATRRTELVTRLTQLYRTLDSLVQADPSPEPERLGDVLEQIESVEGDRGALLTAEHILVERIGDRQRRIALLEERPVVLDEEPAERVAGLLEGTWDLVLMPYDQRGETTLEQRGTLVTGTYRLQGGADGSLTGTFVNRTVRLIRIDSRLGRTMELEGRLSGDGTTIRGSWLNLELAGSEGGTGAWIARRRADPAGDAP